MNRSFNIKKLFIIGLALILTKNLQSQNVFVPDTAFAKYLCDEWRFTMTTSCDSINIEVSTGPLANGRMDFSSRNISEINVMFAYSGIDTVISTNNNITFLPFFPASVDYIDFSNNKLTHSNINHFALNVDLTHYDVSNNIFSRLPNLENAKPNLQILRAKDNYLREVPDLTEFVKLRELNVSNNFLTFEDLIPISESPNFNATEFTIIPQRKRAFNETYFREIEGDDFLFKLDFDDTVSTNTYEWYKDGSLIATTNENSLLIENITLNDSGKYSVIIKNSLPLFSSYQIEFYNTFTVDVFPDLSKVDFDVNTTCNVHEIKLDVLGVSLFQDGILTLKNNSSNKIYIPENNDFLIFESGTFDLIHSRDTTVIQTVSDWVSLEDLPKCSKTVSPNGDNNNDTFYFEYSGTIKIYNKVSQLIQEFQGPLNWDVTNKNGVFLKGGLYFIHYDDNTSETLTVIR